MKAFNKFSQAFDLHRCFLGQKIQGYQFSRKNIEPLSKTSEQTQEASGDFPPTMHYNPGRRLRIRKSMPVLSRSFVNIQFFLCPRLEAMSSNFGGFVV